MERESTHYERWLAAALFLACLLLYHLAPVRQLYDWRYITAVSHSLLHDGDLAVDRSMAERARYQIHEVDGRHYHLFPNAPAVLNLPIVWAYERLGWPVFDGQGRFQGGSESRILRTAAAGATAAAVAVLFLVARLYLPTRWALGLAALFAFGTPLLSTASRPFWSHSWGVLLLSLGLYWTLAPGRHRYLMPAAAATVVAWAVFTRPPFALSALALTALLAVAGRRRPLAVFAGVGAAWLIGFCAYSLAVYGEPVPPYFYSATTESGRLTADRLLTLQPEAALGTLVSPSRGLFFFTPFLLAVLYAVVRHWRALRDRPLAVAALAVIAAHWYLVSSFRNWRGGASFGPRLFTDLMPWFLVLAAMALAALLARDRERPAPAARRAGRGLLFGLLAAASLFIHVRGATSQATMRHFGLWNWLHPPFLNGLVPVGGLPLPGAQLRWDAGVDDDPSDGWQNLTRRSGFDLELHGSVAHAPIVDGPPGIGGAFRFRGAGGGTCRSFQELGGRPNVTIGAVSVEIWFRPAVDGAGGVLVESGGGDRGLTLFLRQGRPALEVRSGGRRRRALLDSPVAAPAGKFSQLVAVVGPLAAGRRLTLYLDGEPVAGPLAAPAIDDWAGGNPTGVGTDDAHPGFAAGDFEGEIALVQLYRLALEADQVAHNFRAVAGG